MSAGIETNDKIVSVEKCWHGLETIEREIVFANSGLDWTVVSKPVYFDLDRPAIPNYQAIVREDKGIVLNVPKSSYSIIQNERVWQALEESLKGVDYQVVTTGSLGDCRRIFISIVLKQAQSYMVNREQFKNHITFVSSHDGTMAFEAYDCSTRVVCQNTLNMSQREKGKLNLKVYHCANHEFKISEMEQEIETLLAKRDEFYKSYEYLATRPMSMERANKVLHGVLVRGDEISAQSKNTVNSILSKFTNGMGNKGTTFADLLNGFTEHYTHSISKKNSFATFNSSEFGLASQKKAEFFDILMDDAQINKLAKRGETLLASAMATA